MSQELQIQDYARAGRQLVAGALRSCHEMEATGHFDRSALEEANEEEAFDQVAADLIDALSAAVTEAAELLPTDDEGIRSWTRDEAICAGLVVRCSKLLRAYAGHFREQEFEVCNYLMRGISESLVNLRFLLRFGSPEMLQRFRVLSFRGDKQMLTRIDDEIEARSGLVLPIEDRIRAAIERRLGQAEVRLDEVPDGGRARWGGTDKEKVEALDIEDLYSVLFVGSSAYVHGTWHELVTYHLREAAEGGFEPDTAFAAVRPQSALALCRFTCEALSEYLSLRFPEIEELGTGFVALAEAAVEIDQLHENYIARTGGPELSS